MDLKQSTNFDLTESTIHVWHADYRSLIPDNNQFKSYLSKQELECSHMFGKLSHQNQFVCRRGLLRQLLAHYLKTHPKNVEIYYNEKRKPFTKANIQFSVSHSNDKLVIAFTLNQPIGVDIEWINPLINPSDIAHLIFNTSDLNKFYQLHHEEQRLYFFENWVIKEAALKALGTGFFEDPKNVIYSRDSNRVSFILDSSDHCLKVSILPTNERYFCAVAHQKLKKTLEEYTYGHWRETLSLNS